MLCLFMYCTVPLSNIPTCDHRLCEEGESVLESGSRLISFMSNVSRLLSRFFRNQFRAVLRRLTLSYSMTFFADRLRSETAPDRPRRLRCLCALLDASFDALVRIEGA